MKVLIPQDIADSGKDYLKERGYEVVVGSGFDEDTIIREGADADAVIMRTAPYTAKIMDALKQCKIYARFGVGTDNVDVEAATRNGAYVTIAKNANQNSVAEHTVTLILALAKRLVHLDVMQKKDAVENFRLRNSLPTIELRGKTAAIIGLGAIGREVARQLHDGLCMEIIGYDAYIDASVLPSYIKTVPLEQCITDGDVISIHTPATPETLNMIDKAALHKMKERAIVVNCARGGIINEKDLYEALKENRIFGAGMDVFVSEPTERDNPLLTLDNFIGSPHNAGLSYEAADYMALSCAKAIDDVLNGRKPEYPINDPQ